VSDYHGCAHSEATCSGAMRYIRAEPPYWICDKHRGDRLETERAAMDAEQKFWEQYYDAEAAQ
jgi:hypothetical protein